MKSTANTVTRFREEHLSVCLLGFQGATTTWVITRPEHLSVTARPIDRRVSLLGSHAFCSRDVGIGIDER